MIDNPALGWGVHIDRVEIKDVALPESMKRSMSRQAEAERERRSRVITADGELQASQKLAEAADVMAAASGRAAVAPAPDRRRGCRREELDSGPALPRRAASLPGTLNTSRAMRSSGGVHGPLAAADQLRRADATRLDHRPRLAACSSNLASPAHG